MNFRILLMSAVFILAAFATIAAPPTQHAKRQVKPRYHIINRAYPLTPLDLAARRQLQRLRKAANADDLLINRKTN